MIGAARQRDLAQPTEDSMTEQERALWKQAQSDYTHALQVAVKAWQDTDAGGTPIPTPEAIQAGAATVLIHITKLRQEGPRSTPTAAPAAVAREVKSSQAPVAAPACPQCGGDMWDNRGKKKNPKGPDFSCKDKTCVDAKGYKTGLWERDLKKVTVAAGIRDGIDSFADMPKALEDEDPNSLPF